MREVEVKFYPQQWVKKIIMARRVWCTRVLSIAKISSHTARLKFYTKATVKACSCPAHKFVLHGDLGLTIIMARQCFVSENHVACLNAHVNVCVKIAVRPTDLSCMMGFRNY